MVDPTTEACPDYAGALYAGIRTDLTAATGQTEQEVIDRLVDTWNTGHEERVLAWEQQQENEALAVANAERAREAQEEAEHALQEAEAQKEHAEAEKKKPKMNGFKEASTVGDFLAPRPSQYAVQKLTNFEYIELWNFSPDGCKEALKTSKSVADDYGLTKVDDQLTIRPASAFKASKAALADHELPFSVFLRAKNMFLVQISQAKWPQTHVDALSLFFWRLENHAIRNHSDIGDMVILNYASRVRHDWHDCLKRDEGFNIGNLNETLLCTISEELWDKVRSRTLTLPSSKDSSTYQSSFRKSSYRDTRSNNHRNHDSRSRSPVRGGGAQKGRSSSPDNTRDKSRREGFSRGAGSRGRSACAVCLGRFAHDIRHCNSSNLWDGSNAHCRRAQDGRIINPQGLPLCYKWQRPESCAAPNHESSHECSGCGSKDHGVQKCSRVEKA
ncbi:uncharacterized protein EDB91DRAFT_1208983 [Suillus paluster]|uniref:uncharacterized protein n=1 Tax=Suillus paluster TaxID=48578 RepID=UPI001B86F9C7|nr:uncharacterized protein EDB91DRAFT_1208983 [Suillus paluster]KAG1725487.1 hypothetical protein EDB91DRAFT_1208983 [Suillus paluster]